MPMAYAKVIQPRDIVYYATVVFAWVEEEEKDAKHGSS